MEERNLTLLTDLYQLTMMDGYYRQGRKEELAVFDLFFRQNGIITYSIAAGLEQAVDYILNINFGEDEIEYLKGLNIFSEGFLNYLKDSYLNDFHNNFCIICHLINNHISKSIKPQ